MPNVANAKKALRSAAKRRVFNDRRRKTMKTEVKAFSKKLADKDVKGATELLPVAYKAIDKAAKGGVIKKQTAARKKSNLARGLATAGK